MWTMPDNPDDLDRRFDTERHYLTHSAEKFSSWDHYYESRRALLEPFNRPGQIEELRRLFDAHHGGN